MKQYQLLEIIKAKALKLNIWNSSIGDRLTVDSIQKTEIKVTSLGSVDSNLSVANKIKCRHYDKMPVHLLPNCSSYVGVNNKLSGLFGIFDCMSRSEKQGGRIMGGLSTNRNGYIIYRMNSLGGARDKGHYNEYGRQFGSLMKNPTFQMCALNFVVKNGHLDKSGVKVQGILEGLVRLIETKGTTIDYKRVYIPKGKPEEEKGRPLGVPETTGRVYLHMLNVGIVGFRMREHDEQHAYLPKKGTYTCGKAVGAKLQQPNIFEFDIVSFFPSVILSYQRERMISIGIPAEGADRLTLLNRSIVKLTDDDKLEEPHRKVIYNSDGSLNSNLDSKLREELTNNPNLVTELLKQGYTKYVEVGVPQGASTSCGLATLNLGELFKRYALLIMYADDGLLFPNTIDNPDITVAAAGVNQAEEKSGGVKKNHVGQKSLKFLGLEFIPAFIQPSDESAATEYPRLRGCTRNGSKLEFTEKLQFLCYVSKIMTEDRFVKLREKGVKEGSTVGDCIIEMWNVFILNNPMDRLGLLFNSPAGPTIMSYIYNGTEKLQEPADARLLYRKNSGVHMRYSAYIFEIVTVKQGGTIPELLLNKLIEALRDEMAADTRRRDYRQLSPSSLIEGHVDTIVKDKENVNIDNVIAGHESDKSRELAKLEQLLKFVKNHKDDPVSRLALLSLFKFRKDLEEKLRNRIATLGSEEIGLNIEIPNSPLWNLSRFKKFRKLGKEFMKYLKVDLYNASSFACHDLLDQIYLNESPRNGAKKSRNIRYLKIQKLVNTEKEQLKKEFEDKKVMLKKKLLKRSQKELNKTYNLPAKEQLNRILDRNSLVAEKYHQIIEVNCDK